MEMYVALIWDTPRPKENSWYTSWNVFGVYSSKKELFNQLLSYKPIIEKLKQCYEEDVDGLFEEWVKEYIEYYDNEIATIETIKLNTKYF